MRAFGGRSLGLGGLLTATVLVGSGAVSADAAPGTPVLTAASNASQGARKAPTNAAAHPWEETSRGDGITTYKREVPGSEIIALRGVGTVNAPLMRVASVLLDYARAPEWVDSLEDVRVVRMLGPLEFIEYDRVSTPPIIMKDRDFVCRGKLSIDLAEQTFTMTIEPATDQAVPPDDRYVRGELRGYWKLSSIAGGKQTRVVTEMHGDPKGGVPKWLVNMFQDGWARSTIESLREQLAKPDIRIMPEVREAFEGKPIRLRHGRK